jgi:uncharacterized protein
MLEEGTVHSVRSRGRAAGKDRFSQYRDFREAVGSIPSHRFLAIRRGVREKALSYSVEIDVARARETFRRRVGLRPERPWSYFVGQAADDAYERLLEPAIQAQVRTFLRSRAENEAIRVFEDNLRALLLAPPAGRIPVLGIEAGHGRSLRLAAVDADGKLLEGRTLSLQEPPETTTRALGELAERHRIRGIAIGGRTGSREAEELARSALAGHADIFVVTVQSGGASPWAASPAAKAELPDLDAATRSAVSIARRLQDPLAELVKIDPKAIGVGQYQHDVNQKRLERSLANTLESAVGRVGADVNTATVDLLKHVPGLGEARARAIVDHRVQKQKLLL